MRLPSRGGRAASALIVGTALATLLSGCGCTQRGAPEPGASPSADVTSSPTAPAASPSPTPSPSESKPAGDRGFEAAPRPTIGGRFVVGRRLTADPGNWRPTGARFSYDWLRDGEPIADADEQEYRLAAADLGSRISVRVTARLDGFATTRKVSELSDRVAAGQLTETPNPTISGTTTFGQTLTADAGAWGPGSVRLAYQWLRNGEAIRGATNDTYRLVADDVGAVMKVRVRGTREGFEAVSRTSRATAKVNAAALTQTPTPRIRGSAVYFEWLTVEPGEWGPGNVNLSYQWRRNGEPIPGATGRRYQVHVADIGTDVTVRVTGRRAGFQTGHTTSEPVRPVAAPLSPAPAPKVSGKAVFGQTLTADAGTWGPGTVNLSYQWYRDGEAVEGASGRTLKLTADDVGASMKVRVTGSKLGHKTTRKHSAETGPVAAAKLGPTPVPTVSGYTWPGQKLTAYAGTWGPGSVTLSYQWYKQKADAAAVKIPKANSATYLITTAEVGYKLKVQVTGKKPGYASKSVYSELSRTVSLR